MGGNTFLRAPQADLALGVASCFFVWLQNDEMSQTWERVKQALVRRFEGEQEEELEGEQEEELEGEQEEELEGEQEEELEGEQEEELEEEQEEELEGEQEEELEGEQEEELEGEQEEELEGEQEEELEGEQEEELEVQKNWTRAWRWTCSGGACALPLWNWLPLAVITLMDDRQCLSQLFWCAGDVFLFPISVDAVPSDF